MSPEDIFTDKTVSAKEKVTKLSKQLLSGKLNIEELIRFAGKAKDPVLAGCIEAMEFTAQKDPSVITAAAFDFVTKMLKHKAPRVKWESSKVIAHCTHLFPEKLKAAIPALLDNTGHAGAVVRWSAATALVQILRTGKHKELAGAFEAVIKREEKNSIRKIYEAALKEARK